MSHSKQISDELKSISSLVASYPSDNAYMVPAGYFDNLAENIIQRINSPEQEEKSYLLTGPKQNAPYTIAENYFDQFPSAMLRHIKLQEATSEEELQILCPLLLTIRNSIPFKLPPSFLEEFAPIMIRRIELEEQGSEQDESELLSPLLGKLKHSLPYKLPDGYFEEFPLDITAGVHAVDYVNQELESFPPVLKELKVNVYKVPESYFNTLPDKVLKIVKSNRNAPVISGNFSRKILSYAVAALVAGIVCIAGWTFYNDKPALTPEKELAGIRQVSNDEMIYYLESNPANLGENYSTNISLDVTEEDAEQALFANVPDEDLQHYLDQQSVTKDL
jgi:hypothetical protein